MSAGGLWACRRRRGNRTSREAGACSCCFQTSAVNEKEASTLLPKPRPVLGPPGPAVARSGFTVARRTCPESTFRTTFRSPLTWQQEENSLAVRGSSCWTHKWRDRGVSSLGHTQRSLTLTAGLRAGVRRLSGSRQRGLASGTRPERSVAGPPCHGAVFSGPRGLGRCHLVMLGWSGTLGECLGPLF